MTDNSLAAQDPNVTVWRSVINTYLCPSDSVGNGIMDNMMAVTYSTNNPFSAAVTCYVGSTGDMRTGNTTWDIYSLDTAADWAAGVGWGCNGAFRGMFGECSNGKSIGIRDCTDGTSNTFLAGENSPEG